MKSRWIVSSVSLMWVVGVASAPGCGGSSFTLDQVKGSTGSSTGGSASASGTTTDSGGSGTDGSSGTSASAGSTTSGTSDTTGTSGTSDTTGSTTDTTGMSASTTGTTGSANSGTSTTGSTATGTGTTTGPGTTGTNTSGTTTGTATGTTGRNTSTGSTTGSSSSGRTTGSVSSSTSTSSSSTGSAGDGGKTTGSTTGLTTGSITGTTTGSGTTGVTGSIDGGPPMCAGNGVTFRLNVPDNAGPYCANNCGLAWLTITPANGGTTVIPITPNMCEPDCSMCGPVACPPIVACMQQPLTHNTPDSFTWTGQAFPQSTCTDPTSGAVQLACNKSQCVQPGSYVAKMCAPRANTMGMGGTTGTVVGGACMPILDQMVCVSVPFNLPLTSGGMVVQGALPP